MVGMKLMRAAVAGACAACVALPGTALAGTLDQQQPNGEGASLQIQNTQSLAQTFTAGLTGGLDQVDLKLSGTGPTQPLIVEIRNSTAGSPGGTVLASGSIPTSAAPAVTAFVSLGFATPPPVAAGTQYAIVAYTGGADLYGWGAAVTNPYAGGTTFGTATSPPVTWTAFPAVDLAFKTYVDTTSTTYDFTGFLSPVNNPTDPDPNSVKAGQSVPVKFSLGGDQGLDVLDDEAPNPKLVFSSCDPTDEADPVGTSTANNGLTYDALTDTYTYVWKTVKSWKGKCGTFTLKLDDGSVHTAEFLFK